MKPSLAPAAVLDCCSDPLKPLAPQVLAKLENVRQRLENPANGRVAWQQLLNDGQRVQLGGDFVACWNRFNGVVAIWLALHPVWHHRAVIEVAYRIGTLPEVEYRWLDSQISPADPFLAAELKSERKRELSFNIEERIEAARWKYQLLLVTGAGVARLYWKGDRHRNELDKNPKLWDFLWTLATCAKRDQAVGWDQLKGQNESALKDRRSRLKDHIPAELNAAIKAIGQQRYKLKLQWDQIDLIDAGDEWLMEMEKEEARDNPHFEDDVD